MPRCIRRTFLWLLLGLLAGFCAVNGAAEVAILQLANFTPGDGTIVVDVPRISCDTACSVSANLGDTMTLIATPEPGSEFDAWTGDCSGSAARCTLVMDGPKLVVASFKPAGDPLTTVHRFMPGSLEGQAPQGDLLAVDGYLYGMTASGGAAGEGTIFRELPDGSQHVVLHQFIGGPFDGESPTGSLIESAGVLYGMTYAGGANGSGVIFKLDPDGSDYTLLHTFAGGATDGSYPSGSLVALSGVLYGMTYGGGVNGYGTIFQVNPDGSAFTVLQSFLARSGYPSGSLVESGGVLYGVTRGKLPGDPGTLFRIDPDGSDFAVLHSLAESVPYGQRPCGSLLASGGVLYGMTLEGGIDHGGTIFRIGTDGSGYTVIHVFDGLDGFGARGSLILSGGVLYGMTSAGGVNWTGTIFKLNPDGRDFRLLHTFGSGATDGVAPVGSPVELGGILYGMTSAGGANSTGTVFRIGTDGTGYRLLHSFAGGVSDGEWPSPSVLVFGGALYGMTSRGGTGGSGTIFKVNPDGSGFGLLHSFADGGADGSYPYGSLIEFGGMLYGMTPGGGAANNGTVFRVDPDGSALMILHSFAGGSGDGSDPYGSALIESGGVLYGVTTEGGASDLGTVFRIGTDASGYRLLHSFIGGMSDGQEPLGSLIESGGVLYGVTCQGGASGLGTVFRIGQDGGGYGLVHSFAGGASDGAYPSGSLLVFGGLLYGVTSGGGNGLGTIFAVNPDGSGFTVLHSFAGGTGGGSNPWGALVASGGVLYGVTGWGGDGDLGAVFKVNRDGSGFALLHSFTRGAWPARRTFLHPFGLRAPPVGPLTSIDGSLYGVTPFGGFASNGVLFRVDVSQSRARRRLPRE